jgi:hypothetical protein
MLLINGAFASAEVLMQMRTTRSTPYLSIQGWRCTTCCNRRWQGATPEAANEGHCRPCCTETYPQQRCLRCSR